jgi:RND family efflux transporter MFP subunit
MKILKALALMILSCPGINAYAESFDAAIDFPPPVELSLPVSGIVDKVMVSAGQQLKKGETILSLDETPFKADRQLMQSRVAFRQARLTEATRDRNHQQELFDRTVLSSVELENAELRVKRDTALLESAKAQLARANYDYSVSQLKAPFDAIVMTVEVNAGQAINNVLQSKTLVSVVRQEHYIARFNVAAAKLEKIKIQTPGTVIINDSKYPAGISAIFYESAEKSYTVEAGFSAESGLTPVGKKASVVIE